MSNVEQVKSSSPKELTNVILKVYQEDIDALHKGDGPFGFYYRWNYDTLLGHVIRYGKKRFNRYELPVSYHKISQLKKQLSNDGRASVVENFNDPRYDSVYELLITKT